MTTRVVVIGGGVIGVTTAAALARRGLQVTLLERSQTLGSGVTARNGGQLSYSYADALAAPSIWRDLPRLLAGLDPAFRIHANLSPDFLGWAIRFLTNCTTARFVANTRAVLRLALQSQSALAVLEARHPELDFKHTATGKLHLYRAAKKFAAAKAAMHLKNDLGCDQRALAIDELLAIEPALSAGRRNIVGGIYSPGDEAGDPYLFTQGLAALAAREYGLAVLTSTAGNQFILEGRRIRAVRTPHGLIEADLFVLAAGCDSAALAKTVGIRLPIYPMKGYSITLPATPGSPTVSITDTQAKIVFCRLQDQVRIAGMAEIGRADDAIDARRIDSLMSAARTCLPAAADWRDDPNAWTGLRPMTPDSRPIVGATPIANLFLNCGHGMLGWTLACGSAELTAAVMVEERRTPETRALADDFSLTRFSR